VTRLCWFKWEGAPDECDHILMRCHVVSQRVIKREHGEANPRIPRFDFEPTALTGTDLAQLLADPRNWRRGCWHHHQMVDGPGGEWPAIPESAREFARQHDLERFLPRERSANASA
jgi:hypothetical protein